MYILIAHCGKGTFLFDICTERVGGQLQFARVSTGNGLSPPSWVPFFTGTEHLFSLTSAVVSGAWFGQPPAPSTEDPDSIPASLAILCISYSWKINKKASTILSQRYVKENTTRFRC